MNFFSVITFMDTCDLSAYVVPTSCPRLAHVLERWARRGQDVGTTWAFIRGQDVGKTWALRGHFLHRQDVGTTCTFIHGQDVGSTWALST